MRVAFWVKVFEVMKIDGAKTFSGRLQIVTKSLIVGGMMKSLSSRGQGNIQVVKLYGREAMRSESQLLPAILDIKGGIGGT